MSYLYKLDSRTLEIQYLCLLRPILEYGKAVWCNIAKLESDLIESAQSRAGRIVTGAIIRTPTNVVYNELRWESL